MVKGVELVDADVAYEADRLSIVMEDAVRADAVEDAREAAADVEEGTGATEARGPAACCAFLHTKADTVSYTYRGRHSELLCSPCNTQT